MTFSKYLSAFLLLALCADAAQAVPPRRQRWYSYQPTPMYLPPLSASPPHFTHYPPAYAEARTVTPVGPRTETGLATNPAVGGEDALAEVNAARAQRGLPPYHPDPLLNQAARACAAQRAARHISGHLPESDFAYVPPGASASSAGCAAWTPDWGWGSCCTYDHYTYAGASWVMGQDGRRYMHLFVR